MATARGQSDVQWVAAFPDFKGWVQLRVQHLQQDSCEWPPVLLKQAVKWAAANSKQTVPAVGGKAGAARAAGDSTSFTGRGASPQGGEGKKSQQPAGLE